MHPLGSTRSQMRREYLLHTLDAFVRTPLPGLQKGAAIVHVAPQGGAQFAMSTLQLEPGSTLASGPVQRFVYVLQGQVELALSAAQTSEASRSFAAGGFTYLPGDMDHRFSTAEGARLVLFEKPYTLLHASTSSAPVAMHSGCAAAVPGSALEGDEAVEVRCLMPPSLEYDFAVNLMTYQPGACLPQVEVHYMEHGLLMLEGAGIYRLGDDWHPVTAGDAIWMAPFCPQWFAAVGKQPAKYIIYKNFNRHVLA